LRSHHKIACDYAISSYDAVAGDDTIAQQTTIGQEILEQ
jgi:hypothetical protein